jgi:5-methylcytosine-specific restriction endonuclease McrA
MLDERVVYPFPPADHPPYQQRIARKLNQVRHRMRWSDRSRRWQQRALRAIERWGDRCHYCDRLLRSSSGAPESVTLDHVIPDSRGGTRRSDNLVPACAHCNRDKAAKTPLEWLGNPCCEEHYP